MSDVMRLLTVCLLAVLAVLAGCANPLHYGWAYEPLHDPNGALFAPRSGDVEYREVADLKAMVEAERDFYRKGYIMVGYSNMYSPQPSFLAPANARAWAENIGAEAVLHTFDDGHYLATFWSKPKTYVFGAYYSEDLPPDARAALQDALAFDRGVIVESVVQGSPASGAGVRPGDLLIAVNNERIQGVRALDRLLRKHGGRPVTLLVWSMREGAPHPVEVALNRAPD